MGASRIDVLLFAAGSDERILIGPTVERRSTPSVVAMAESSGVTSKDVDRSRLAQIVIEVDERHGHALFGFALRLGLASDQADDAVQEVLMRLYRTLEAGTAIGDPRGWSFRTIYRIAMDEHRLRRRLEALRDRLGRTQRFSGGDDIARRVSLWSDVDRLPARQRQIVYLRYKADLTFEEIAATMGITAGGARAIVNRAMTSLRAVVEREGEP